ncbi:tRNA (adenosine(37)-N6)-threonylcarbamoyltransferase complex ATPase subunit type 1 TsaE [Paracidovorax anthurii]|uniref:tRNA threonylcarbamoyladenosine biosynthesis protein TsaE n=1 Tax=Paracidovorax anthurii TaxID=78229 RepID=A0A328ZK82_9BURK|nr:tRNA (adenosine(37)-N6)-threonylcarbamoyltransferase complex ATPase subunit type 1 TsaE [Paracidovorax anthurii]RAR82826.1 tRNA threonylcarbamoyladenosine biosynthesis protein TsaE [Paracidovorax anthurii]
MTAARHHPGIVESPPAPAGAQLAWHGEDDTAAFAARLAAQPALGHAFITLHGDLGAGKTTLVRHLLRALGVQGRIKSPTYAVVEPHDAPGLAIWHFDFYRFSDPREWEDAGFRDIFAGPGLKIAEWPEKAAGLIPAADLAIHIEAVDDAAGAYDGDAPRQVTLRAGTPLGHTLVQGLTTA